MIRLTPSAKLRTTVALFAVALLLSLVTVVTHTSAPLFVAWLPLLGVAWVLSRPNPGEQLSAYPVVGEDVGTTADQGEDEDEDDDWDDDDSQPDAPSS
jgi:hypothetical protein